MASNLKDFFQDLQRRGLIANAANLEDFYQLETQQKVVYLGIDCTAESLHIGHLFLLFQTARFAKQGFKTILLLGGATSKIGDPSDKLKERPQLETKKIENYQVAIKQQLEKIITKPKEIGVADFSPLELFFSDNPQLLNNIYKILEINSEDSQEKKWKKYLEYVWPFQENKYQILNNKTWLEKINFIDFIGEVGRNISINYLLAKETIKKRLTTGLSYAAFSYSLLQSYDFYYLYRNYNCHGQLGGSDQWGNLTTGLKLIRGIYPENKTFALNFPLLADREGKKFSKSENSKNTLRLNSDKKDFYDFFRNMPDEQVKTYIKQFTFLSENQIEELLKLNNPPSLRICQRILYELIFWFSYGEIAKIK